MSRSNYTLHETVSFTANDGLSLTGTLFEAVSQETNSPAHTALLINSGTGIPRYFYNRFAEYAASKGFVVLTYDYRGIGDSAPKSLKGFDARYRDWGQQDVPGAIRWLKDRYQNLPLTVIGHSTGGQQLGLAQNIDDVNAAAFVGVSTGYWRGMPTTQKWLTFTLWKTYVPLMTWLLGYAPAKKIGWGEDLPAGVAKEWGSWCLQPEYLAAFFDDAGKYPSFDNKPFGDVHFSRADFPIRAFCFTDDEIATRANVPPLMSLYEKAKVEISWINPKDIGISKIGHLGFFRSKTGSVLWDEMLDWLLEQVDSGDLSRESGLLA